MLTLQDVGTEILTGHPRKFYIFTGSEYGIKCKYIQSLKEQYPEYLEAESVESIISMMSVKRLVPLKPTLYVIRYDDAFLQSLSDKTQDKILKTNIIGTVVCLYESESATSKLSKYVPDLTVRIDNVDLKYLYKYLSTDFPGIPDNIIKCVSQCCNGYADGSNMCSCLSMMRKDELDILDNQTILQLFGKQQSYDEKFFKILVASRNFSGLVRCLDSSNVDKQSMLYAMLSVMIELEKLLTTAISTSDILEYKKLWTLKDVYNMFMNCYDQLDKLRSITTDIDTSLLYLFSLLKFKQIPDMREVL